MSDANRERGYGVPAWFAVVFVVLVTFAVVTFRNTTRLAESEAGVAHTYEVLNVLEATLSALKDAQNGYRGYHATGNGTLAKPFHDAEAALPALVTEFEHLTTDRPGQQRRAAEFREQSAAVLRIYGRGMRVRQDEGFEASERFVRDGAGNAEMDKARALIADMEAEERRLLADRAGNARRQYSVAIVTTALSVGLGLLLTGVAFRLTLRDLRRRTQTAAELQAARDSLEERVRVRTAALHESARRLEESNRELEQFATVASHDLQEPLRKIQAFSDRLRDVAGPLLQGAAQDYLARIVTSAGRMRTLIDDLLSFSRVTRKGQPFVPTDLNLVAADVVSDLEGRLKDVGGRVDVGPLPPVSADPSQIRQLLQNLIANGLKFRKPTEPPVVSVHAEVVPEGKAAAGAVCRLTVADNGIGFEPVYAERIFQMFQRLHGRGQYEGNGIGLAICRKIVERHHGTITAASEPGVGSSFIVTLPMEQTTLE